MNALYSDKIHLNTICIRLKKNPKYNGRWLLAIYAFRLDLIELI